MTSKFKSSKNSNHSESEGETTFENSKSITKFQDLPIVSYIVKSYSDPIKSKYGTSYKLTIQNKETKGRIDIWSTKLLANYIKEEKPKKAFKFTVKVDKTKKENNKYPSIHGYEACKMHELESCSDSE